MTTTKSPKGKTRKRSAAAGSAKTPAPVAGKRGASVEPRLAARRVEVKRSEGRRRLNTLLALCLITLFAVGALAFLQSSMMDVDHVVVVGAEHTSDEAILAASGVVLGDPLVDIDGPAIAAGVSPLPWIASVDVVREWNGTITIAVTERLPAIAVPLDDSAAPQLMLVDVTGRQLELVEERPYGFMPIAGLFVSGEPGQPAPSEAHGVIRLLSLLSPERQQDIDQIVVDERNLYLDLAEQGRVRLGSESGLSEKLVSLDTILATVDLRCLWEIDVRVHTAPAVTRLRTDGVAKAPLTDLSTCT